MRALALTQKAPPRMARGGAGFVTGGAKTASERGGDLIEGVGEFGADRGYAGHDDDRQDAGDDGVFDRGDRAPAGRGRHRPEGRQ